MPDDDEGEIDLAGIELAADETPAESLAPEVDSRTADLTAWDSPLAATGTAAPKVLPEDEVSPVEQLIEEGLDEADRDRRLAAADPDFEP